MDRSILVPDESLTIEEGAVAPWNSLMWSIMVDVCREMGVLTDIPTFNVESFSGLFFVHCQDEKIAKSVREILD